MRRLLEWLGRRFLLPLLVVLLTETVEEVLRPRLKAFGLEDASIDDIKDALIENLERRVGR